MPKPCRLCGNQLTPFKSRGAELGDVNLCAACVNRAMGREIDKATYLPKLASWLESVRITQGGK